MPEELKPDEAEKMFDEGAKAHPSREENKWWQKKQWWQKTKEEQQNQTPKDTSWGEDLTSCFSGCMAIILFLTAIISFLGAFAAQANTVYQQQCEYLLWIIFTVSVSGLGIMGILGLILKNIKK